jgi:hypothetical protein
MRVRIEGREVPPIGTPISPEQLRDGAVYFSVNYLDEDLTLPVMEPLVFVGRSLDGADSGLVYFQDADSYRRGVRYPGPDEMGQARFWQGAENELNHIFTFELAFEELVRCAARRGFRPPMTRPMG